MAPETPEQTSGGTPDLSVLDAFDRLEVGPVRLEPARLVAPYRVIRGTEVEETELTYKYEEEVFAPDDPVARNLAGTIAAQVALNYGLFCREIVFRGTYDAVDARLLREMARNTARDIYVNKLRASNPFLQGPVRNLPPGRPDDFLRAELRFESEASIRGEEWETTPGRCAVLSSGGKDSLLSYGLLDEIGREVHPIFVNESGRHWNTALNAYRYFRESEPRTARVWTNADRVFNWMLRRLPFVRPDFARLRADIYPIRLWTVAVFSFGALPLLRKRGVGRLVIGDEHDTTVRERTRGVPHYAGLYDQSRWFDNRMSRYFARKRWNVAQFSVLRPLSELLIEKTLAERYPALLRQQVSCHAAHVDGERVRPCGRCEKCRRIVGMLVAIGADPGACGYDAGQIAGAMAALRDGELHQEGPAVEHLSHLLVTGGHLAGPIAGSASRPRPEVVKLRFERDRAPLETMPVDLRAPLYRILLAHAEGAVRRQGPRWVPFDALSDESLGVPYRFERLRRTDPDVPGPGERFLLGEFTWPEARRHLRAVDIALLPVGATEQHGPHLPLDVDAYDADRLCREVAAACGVPRPLVLPVVSYGVSYHHDDFAGTLSLSPDTLAQFVYEIGMCLARQGIAKLVIVNGHGGNSPALHFAAQKINRDAHIFTCVDSGESSDAEVDAMAETPNDVHAGEIETSTTLALRPEVVRLRRVARSVPRFSSEYLEFSSRKGVGWYVRTARLSRHGVMGDPTKASAEKGRRMWAAIVRNLVELVEDLKGMSLDEIYQRRY